MRAQGGLAHRLRPLGQWQTTDAGKPVNAAAEFLFKDGAKAYDGAPIDPAVLEAQQKALYAAAESQNVRRRLEGEKVAAAAYATTGFARDLLSVRDHLERALTHVPEGLDDTTRNFVAGIEATLRELDTVFGRNNGLGGRSGCLIHYGSPTKIVRFQLIILHPKWWLMVPLSDRPPETSRGSRPGE